MKQIFKEFSLGALLIIAALIVASVVGVMWLMGFGVFKKATADFRGDVAATERVHANGAYRIAAYDEFFNRCAAIQAKEQTITILEDELATAEPDRKQIIQMTLTGIKAGRASDITQYNANAAKSETLANFMDSNLPYSIDPNKETTTCTA